MRVQHTALSLFLLMAAAMIGQTKLKAMLHLKLYIYIYKFEKPFFNSQYFSPDWVYLNVSQ